MAAITPTLRSNLAIVLASARMRTITITRYPGQLVMDIVAPIIFAAMPILLGRASGGANAVAAFAENTGTTNYVSYMLIGSSAFSIVTMAFWHIAYWLRHEMESGTLEALYLAPAERLYVAAGTALYSCARGLLAAFISYLLGSRLLGVDPLQGEVLLAFGFIVSGLVPLYGIAMLFGSLVLKLKEASALINLMQWGVSFLMGVFFPVALFPPLMRLLALLFPPTWMTNGVRSAMLGIGYFFGKWYLDLAVLWLFLLIAPLAGWWVFSRTETSIRRKEGIGQF